MPFSTVDVRPSVDDIGALLRDRTTLPGTAGDEAGTFTDATRPTETQVEALITVAVGDTLVELPTELPEALYAAATQVVAYRTAAVVDVSNFGEQFEQNPARAEFYERQADRLLASIVTAARDNRPGQARYGSIALTTALTNATVRDYGYECGGQGARA